jgi:branched-chain amino acid transport system substrate-binding protein
MTGGGLENFDGQIGGLLEAVWELGNVPSAKYPPSKAFYDAFKKKYKAALQSGHGPAPAYESVYVLKEAIERAGTIEADAVVKALEQTDRAGVMGRVKFDSHQAVWRHDPLKFSMISSKWNWRAKIVYPPPSQIRRSAPEWVLKPVK